MSDTFPNCTQNRPVCYDLYHLCKFRCIPMRRISSPSTRRRSGYAISIQAQLLMKTARPDRWRRAISLVRERGVRERGGTFVTKNETQLVGS